MMKPQFYAFVLLFFSLGSIWCLGEETPFVPSVELAQTGEGVELTVHFKVASASHLYSDGLTVNVEGGRTEELGGDLPEDFQGDAVYRHDFTRVYRVTGIEGNGPWRVTIEYMGCLDSGLCLPPATKEFIVGLNAGAPVSELSLSGKENGTATGAHSDGVVLWEGWRLCGKSAGYMDKGEFLKWLSDSLSDNAPVINDRNNILERCFTAYGLWLAILVIIPLGVLLNFTPCVLPMMPVTLAVIGAGMQAGRKRGLMLGGAYGAGVALAYGGCGAVAVIAGGRFGALNGLWWFNAVTAVVFLLLGLSMFDVFAVDLSRFRSGSVRMNSSGGSVWGAFAMGALSALLSGACVAPVLIWVLLLSAELYSSGAWIGVLLPLFLGIGMALPWPLAGAGISKLPRPGAWMVRIRQLFGVLIVILAVYYGYVAFRQAVPAESRATVAENVDSGDALNDLTRAMELARTENKALLIDFWGQSCKNCELMDAHVFTDDSVRKALENVVRVKCLGDNGAPTINLETMKHFGVQGFPTFVIVRFP